MVTELRANKRTWEKLHRLDTTRSVVIVNTDGTLDTVRVTDDSIIQGWRINDHIDVTDEAVNDLHSLAKDSTVYLFVARQTVLEKWSFSIEQGLLVITFLLANLRSFGKFIYISRNGGNGSNNHKRLLPPIRDRLYAFR